MAIVGFYLWNCGCKCGEWGIVVEFGPKQTAAFWKACCFNVWFEWADVDELTEQNHRISPRAVLEELNIGLASVIEIVRGLA